MPQQQRVNKTARKELSPIDRAMIIGRRDAGQTFLKIHQDTGVPLTTIKDTIKRRNNDQLKSLPRQCPRKTSARKDRQIIRSARTDRDQILAELNINVCPDISARTLQRRLREVNIRKWLARDRPPLTEEHAATRLAWAREHVDWTPEQWNKVVWSDECTIEKTCGQAQKWKFRTPQEKWHKDCVNPKATSRPVGQMMWACFHGTTKGACIEIGGDPLSGRKSVTGEVYLNLL
jgi:hypothetical protein